MKKLLFALIISLALITNCSERTRVGSVCNDGTTSTATGRGACSHHGGVDHWIYR